jgi:hypothetical protein
MSSLLRAYEAAKGLAAKKRPFDVAGEAIELPRLTLANRAEFEKWMKKERDKDFSLSLIRNRATLAMAEIVSRVKDEWKAEGKPADFKSLPKDEVEALNSELLERVVRRYGVYAEELFKPFDAKAMSYAVELAMKQEYGTEATQAIVAGILEAAGAGVLDRMCLWVLGLEEWTDQVIEQPVATSLDEAVEQRFGDPKNSETAPATNSPTTKRSRSSAPPTEEAPNGSGA